MYCCVVCKSVMQLVCYHYYVQLIALACSKLFNFFLFLYMSHKLFVSNIQALNYTSTKEIHKVIQSLKAKSSH